MVKIVLTQNLYAHERRQDNLIKVPQTDFINKGRYEQPSLNTNGPKMRSIIRLVSIALHYRFRSQVILHHYFQMRKLLR